MELLLLGDNSTITNTIYSMLHSVDNWTVTFGVELTFLSPKAVEQLPNFDLVIANLEDFETSSIPLITEIINYFPDTPLLVIHSYSDNSFIKPMLNAGATGYIKSDISEHQLLTAAQKVARGQQVVIADSTY